MGRRHRSAAALEVRAKYRTIYAFAAPCGFVSQNHDKYEFATEGIDAVSELDPTALLEYYAKQFDVNGFYGPGETYWEDQKDQHMTDKLARLTKELDESQRHAGALELKLSSMQRELVELSTITEKLKDEREEAHHLAEVFKEELGCATAALEEAHSRAQRAEDECAEAMSARVANLEVELATSTLQRQTDKVDQMYEEAASTLQRIACEAALLHDTDDDDDDEETCQLKAYFAQMQKELSELKKKNQCLQAQKDDMLTKPQVEAALRVCAEGATEVCMRKVELKYNEMRTKYERLLLKARGGD